MSEDNQETEKLLGTREWYNFVAEAGELIGSIHVGGMQATRDLLQMLKPDASMRVLDVGCGAGHTACLIAAQYGASVQGVDLSEVMVAKARARAREMGVADKAEFRVADLARLPFDDGSFDMVVFESLLTPFPGDPQAALAEMVRVLRPGGRIGVNEGTLDPSTPPEALAEMQALFAQHPAIHNTFTAQTLRALFEEAGLRVVQMAEVSSADLPGMQRVRLRGILTFFVRSYPKIALTLLRNERFRKAHQVDEEMTRRMKPYTGYTLVVAEKAA